MPFVEVLGIVWLVKDGIMAVGESTAITTLCINNTSPTILTNILTCITSIGG